MRAAVGLAIAALLGACGMEPDFDGTRFSCEQTSECPDGYACVADQCVPDGTGDEDLEPASCDDASDLRDDFNGSSIDEDWVPFADAGGQASQDDAVYVTVDGSGGAAGFMTRCSYDMTGDRVYVQVEQLPGGDAETFFEIVTLDGNFAAFEQHGGVLTARTKGQGSNRVESASFDAAYEWWMLSGTGDTIEFWSARNDGDWELITSQPIPRGFDSANIAFGVRNDATGTAVEARFDDYNGG